MILVDSSIWIDLLSKKPKFQLTENVLPTISTCPPVVQEVLQGVSDAKAYKRIFEGLLAMPCFSSPVTMENYLTAADIFRTSRKRGITVRSSIDCLIAAIAMESDLTVWHCDRDFENIAKFVDLKTCLAI